MNKGEVVLVGEALEVNPKVFWEVARGLFRENLKKRLKLGLGGLRGYSDVRDSPVPSTGCTRVESRAGGSSCGSMACGPVRFGSFLAGDSAVEGYANWIAGYVGCTVSPGGCGRRVNRVSGRASPRPCWR